MAALTAELDQMKVELETQRSVAQQALDELAQTHQRQREQAIQALFQSLAIEFSDERAAPYRAMDEAMFAAVSADLQATRPAPAIAGLFGEIADRGKDPAVATETSLALQLFNQVAGVKV